MIDINRCTIRKATAEDMLLLFNWRNQPSIRAASLNDQLISLSEHQKWFNGALNNPNNCIYIFALNGLHVGMTRFVRQSEQPSICFWSFYIGDEFAGPGAGSAMGYLTLNDFFSNNVNCTEIRGEVLGSNERSSAFHNKMGFCLVLESKRLAPDASRELKIKLFSLTREKWIQHKPQLESLIFQ